MTALSSAQILDQNATSLYAIEKDKAFEKVVWTSFLRLS